MKKLIVANWKMNPESAEKARELFNTVKRGAKNTKAEVIICPPFLYLPLLKGLPLGAQNVFYKEKGAFTGEVSPLMLKDLGVEYSLVGHSESRKYLQETDDIVNKKLHECLHDKLTPILCIGEKEGESKEEVVHGQLAKSFKGISAHDLKKVIIAYEPVWAVGTGKNCSIDETLQSVVLIRKIISDMYNRQTTDYIKILYGGSVNAKNAAGYLKKSGVDGLLVGGASLDAGEFTNILKAVE